MMSKRSLCGDERSDRFINQFCVECVSNHVLTTHSYQPIEQKSDVEILLERIIALESKINFIELRLQELKVDIYESN